MIMYIPRITMQLPRIQPNYYEYFLHLRVAFTQSIDNFGPLASRLHLIAQDKYV